MDRVNHRSLFLPDLLPCPGSGRCTFHKSIFGDHEDRSQIPDEWFCPKCQTHHPTTVRLNVSADTNHTSPSRLERLPVELLLHIAQFLSPVWEAALALTCQTINRKIGIQPRGITSWEKRVFLGLLAKETPNYAECDPCAVLRPVTSAFAWPLLKVNREQRGVPPTVYGVSDFLAMKVKGTKDNSAQGLCFSLLSCTGELHKPWTTPTDYASLKELSFVQKDLEQGLHITYGATGRNCSDGKVKTHVQYRIELPSPWTSFTIAQRAAVLRGLYLCPHTYAAKVQYRDPDDPAYPSDSSIVHWLQHQGPMPEALWMCSKCPTEFRSQAESKEETGKHFIVFDVWHEQSGSCADGMQEVTFCKDRNNNHGSQLGRIRRMFESATLA